MLPPLARSSTSAARIAPLLRISPSCAGRRTSTLPLPSEPSLSTTSLPEAIAAVPLRAVSEPSLRTWRAISTTSPFDAPILPRLTTEALLLPLKVSDPPARNSASLTSSVEATKLPPVLTTPLGPTTTPDGLTR